MKETRHVDTRTIRQKYDYVVQNLKNNVRKFDCFPKPVLTTGPGYPGIWLEHNHDSLLYLRHDPEVAMASHEIFYRFQAEDGLFPAYICKGDDDPQYRIGYGHVQTVYPLAASAMQIARATGSEEFLQSSYAACARYDGWFMRYRNTRGTGLIEMFCEWDTGHDNSPRAMDGGIPHHCPNGDARICPNNDILPVIAPDLTATVYGGKVALAEMADALGKGREAAAWRESAEEMKCSLIKTCWDEDDGFFYDVDAHGRFRKYRSEHIFRLFLNHVMDLEMADRIYTRYIRNPNHFWTKYPFASISISDPAHDHRHLPNSWGGQSQSHTALEAIFWMEHYGKRHDLHDLMTIWVQSLSQSDKDFTQEMNPLTGVFSDCARCFTTTMLAYTEFVDRLFP
jgi:hypothetical protein